MGEGLQELDDANHSPCALEVLQLHKMARLHVLTGAARNSTKAARFKAHSGAAVRRLRQLQMQEGSIWQLGFQNLSPTSEGPRRPAEGRQLLPAFRA